MSDLFSAAAAERTARHAPLAERLRPKFLAEVVGQEHLLDPGKPLRRLIEADRLSSVILWGPPGTGKTTLAGLVASATSKQFIPMSAVTAGVKDVRDAVERAREAQKLQQRGTILFLDEIHRFNRTQQDALLPSVEDGTLVLIGATTENPSFSVNGPLLSRSTVFRLRPHTPDSLRVLCRRALEVENASIDDDALAHLIARADGDGRSLLRSLEVAIAIADDPQRAEPRRVVLEDAESAVDVRVLHYGDDDHYDIASALIKSIRGSDADASLYWLARMLTAGEDVRFIARRLCIAASEDIGLADPMALVIAEAAARCVEHIGMPEAQINLAQAVVHLALAPKSNAVAQGIWAAMALVTERSVLEVPTHLRDSHYQGAKALGHGQGYRLPHDSPNGWVDQQYLPSEIADVRFYQPTSNGHEGRIAERLRAHRGEVQPERATL